MILSDHPLQDWLLTTTDTHGNPHEWIVQSQFWEIGAEGSLVFFNVVKTGVTIDRRHVLLVAAGRWTEVEHA